MIAPESNRPEVPDSRAADEDRPDQPVTTLRGATVDVDLRLVARVVVGVSLVTLVVLAVILLVAGLHTNSQINRLRQDGVPVSVKVTNCAGLLGGTGSQNAGYVCTGTYLVNGTRYVQNIPGTAVLYPTGSTIQGVVVPSDPKLLSTKAQVDAQHASARVLLVPAILILVAVAWGAGLLVLRRRRRAGGAGTPPRGAR
jgi:uncharacterized SAM-binding protein YcdF (DUF218 family)